jgi:hypothetical protein
MTAKSEEPSEQCDDDAFHVLDRGGSATSKAWGTTSGLLDAIEPGNSLTESESIAKPRTNPDGFVSTLQRLHRSRATKEAERETRGG